MGSVGFRFSQNAIHAGLAWSAKGFCEKGASKGGGFGGAVEGRLDLSSLCVHARSGWR